MVLDDIVVSVFSNAERWNRTLLKAFRELREANVRVRLVAKKRTDGANPA